MTHPNHYDHSVSFWFDSLPEAVEPRAPLNGAHSADVVIVGGGFSGLWTAYYLSQLDSRLQVAILEAEVVGYGASGRNGGWCIGMLSGIESLLKRPDRRAAGLALQRAAFDAVDEVGRVAIEEGIDCHYQKGGSVRVALVPSQADEMREHVRRLHAWGLTDADYRWLEPGESTARLNTASNLGGMCSTHVAALQPARLARGLARVLEKRGVQIYERSRVVALEPRRASTAHGAIDAQIIVRATEAYTARLPRLRRALVPFHTMMIATEPLSEALWDQIGLRNRETFGDGRRITIYGQRTVDNRIAFGGRGTYRFGSRIVPRFAPDDPHFEHLRRTLVHMLPVLRDTDITHRWGGAIGIPRTWRPSVCFDAESGLGSLGGYVGEGVAQTNLAGRTLAELITETDTERTALAWVNQRTPNWEPEPLRWMAVAGINKLGESADTYELRTGKTPALRSALFKSLVGI